MLVISDPQAQFLNWIYALYQKYWY